MKEKFYQPVVENALEMAIFFDGAGKIIYGNATAKKMLEYDEDFEQCIIQDIFPKEFPNSASIRSQVSNMLEQEMSIMAYRKNRTCFSMKCIFYQNQAVPDCYFCLALDETDRNFFQNKADQADKEVQEASKVKTEFVATITHELRTPVNGILANTQALLEKETDESKLYILRMMERGCYDMNGLINNILDFSKLEAGKFTLELREFEFRGMMDYVKSNHQKKIIGKGLDFFVTISPDVPEKIIGDELRIAQVLNNLISNATKFTDFGKISVEVIKTAQIDNKVELFFLIMDTGIGIEKSKQDLLFQSFTQVDASISRKYGGTGLGLNISKQLVELMNGRISVESEYMKGSVFSFHIWVELPENNDSLEEKKVVEPVPISVAPYVPVEIPENTLPVWEYGTAENRAEIEQKMDKLILCVELGNFDKAETFADTLKKLTMTAPQDIKMATLRLKMAVQKNDYDKTVAAYDEWKGLYDGSQ